LRHGARVAATNDSRSAGALPASDTEKKRLRFDANKNFS
jgi:hypothetical protein